MSKDHHAHFLSKLIRNGEIISFSKIKKYSTLANKIVLIENADPGYDFIFSYKIKGLITEYGGANSHMSIRCLELGIPAIIGIKAASATTFSIQNFRIIGTNKNILKL